LRGLYVITAGDGHHHWNASVYSFRPTPWRVI
jgi:hypothetical protein